MTSVHPLLLWFSPPLSSSSQISLQSVLALNQVLCIQDALAHSLFRGLTRYLILPGSRFSQLQHLQRIRYVALLACLYPQIVGLHEATSVDTPMELNVKLRKKEGDLLTDLSLYRKLVGSLVYLTITRSDISFAVQQVNQFLQTPRHLHLATVHRIIRYVDGTSAHGLFFPASNAPRLASYSDAHWAGCAYTRHSIIGWCVFLGAALIS
ncbi:hypothetical protein FEM48_Zijuj01G0201400 [Ziziphus jujuba var. spinosa]|uniref:Mitochondrial protein n=1 Tax=Ziziphus jujuba var. spinosa TaxID=714518 RepID=A0A978W3A9_ZIZJJ|nr:hypothetical protein FEM48_Zijuj01G0201400 [Ziziphus jujuba var. spinosa]